MIDSVFRIGKNYYPQVFLEKCKYVVKDKKIHKYITDDIEVSSDNSDKVDSNEESSDDSENKNSNEESNFQEAI